MFNTNSLRVVVGSESRLHDLEGAASMTLAMLSAEHSSNTSKTDLSVGKYV